MVKKKLTEIGFGGGCHWCTEAVYQALRGVISVRQGFVEAFPPHNSFSEAVLITFDGSLIAEQVLIEIHLRTHASTSNHKMRGKYRSAIYVFDQEQAERTTAMLRDLQGQFDEKLVTQILKFSKFRPSQERYTNYYEKNENGPFCRNYIDPKLALLRAKFSSVLKK